MKNPYIFPQSVIFNFFLLIIYLPYISLTHLSKCKTFFRQNNNTPLSGWASLGDLRTTKQRKCAC